MEFIQQPIFLWFILGLVLLFFAIMTSILLYHWRKYHFESQQIALAEKIYIPVSVILIGFAILSLIIYVTI